MKTGLTGRTVLLSCEDAAAYTQHLDRFFKKYEPADDDEKTLVQSLADTEWRLLRIPSLEMGIYAVGRDFDPAAFGFDFSMDEVEERLIYEDFVKIGYSPDIAKIRTKAPNLPLFLNPTN